MKRTVSIFFNYFFLCFSLPLFAQQPVSIGKGSYAEYTPLYKSRTNEHGGDLSRFMETRKIHVTEQSKDLPIPTNDWWTDILTMQYSGNLWAYPQMVRAETYGVSVAFPKAWEATGHELKWQSQVEVTGKKFKPASAEANTWHDWGFDFLMHDGEKEMRITLAHGVPFTWIETVNIMPQIRAQNASFYSANGLLHFPFTGNAIALQTGNDVYGIYAPDGTVFELKDGLLEVSFAGDRQFLSIATLPSLEALTVFAEYACVIPRQTAVTWDYDETQGKVITRWNITTENLNGKSQNQILQGFIPHHYKHSEYDFSFLPYEYQTPRGKMKMAAGNSFTIAYKFNGILPWFAAPQENTALKNPYRRERMTQLTAEYADGGNFGADTYWGGKGLTQMALYMTFAYETGEMALFEKCKNRLKNTLINWLTYTPGENSFFFARYNHWGGLVGYDTSYDSDTFNDHHFHYGYFTYAAALLALFDEDFRKNYGEMITLVAKDYANWDKTDRNFPFFRTLDPWAGHSYAGGMGNNGNGQESSSEAMQGWGGLYLLGVATGNKAMRDAGIFGWTLEARGTAEYWFDRDRENIDYTKYTSPYNSNLTSQGVGWWTWFSGDPVWMHSIQWMPISPCLKYLYEDPDFARWDYTQMWNKKETGDWTTQAGLPSSLSYESGLGNVVLSYLQIFDPDSAAAVFDTAWDAQMPLARNTDTGGISYFITHSHRSYGDICWDIHADISTATTYKHPQTGQLTHVVYNPESTEQTVRFYQDNAPIQQFRAPGRRLTVYSDAPVLSSVKIRTPASSVVEPGKTLQLEAALFDQYGASLAGNIAWNCPDAGGEISATGLFSAGDAKDISVRITAASGAFSDTLALKINDRPVLTHTEILPRQNYLEAGKTLVFSLSMTDQYGEPCIEPVAWEIVKDGQMLKSDSLFDLQAIGLYTVRAKTKGRTDSTQLYLTPLLPNIALNKTAVSSSEENAGTLTPYAVDGDRSTRWGSLHSDPQWIYADLSDTCYISHATVVWEPAYASLYDIRISNDKQQWETVQTVSGSGGSETVEINRSARYLQIYGRQRATPYGYSLYELEVYGVPPLGNEPAIFALDMQPRNGQTKEHTAIRLTVKGYDRSGNEMPVSPVFRLISGEGEISVDGIFTPSEYGNAVVEAQVGGLTTRSSLFVEESIKLQSLTLSPKNAMVITGSALAFSCAAKDQFGADLSPKSVSYAVAGAQAEMKGNIFSASVPGDYLVIAGVDGVKDTAYVQVADIADVNLAFMKPVAASGYENAGTLPEYVNDGDSGTRWGSLFSDPQWIEIDLSGAYKLNRITILWETAFATKYSVEVSADEEEWTSVFNESNGRGGEKVIDFEGIPARYIRVTTLARATQYGASIFEIKAFGSESLDGTAIRPAGDAPDIQARMSRQKLVVTGESLQHVAVFNAQGMLLFYADLNNVARFEKYLPTTGELLFVKVLSARMKYRVFKVVTGYN